VTPGKKSFQLGLAGLMVVFTASAQTLQQAESLWKARRFVEANDAFKALVGQNPKNPDYKVRWGRLFLDRAQPDDAQAEFEEALALKKDHAGALLGMALIAAENFERRSAELAKKALEADPKLVEAQELLAQLALEDNNNPKAIEEAQKALAIDSNSVGGKAILATIDWLADKKETPWDPKTAEGYAIAARFMTLNRRYDESVQLYRKALQMDPDLDHARSELGIALMRMGQDEEAYRLLKTTFEHGFQDSATRNSLKLMDSYKNFLTFKTDNTIVKVHKKEAELLHPYFENEIKRSIATYEKKYKLKLERPVQVEVYPDHEDFAVRTLGMPGLGALGVTFGYAIAMDSPSGRPPGQFHWASTLWHEMSHVFTLTKTGHRVPRWFTEGLAVHEETAVSPEWGDRLGPDEIAAIKDKKLLPITELDRGFIHPTNPAQVVISYFQAGRICDYINEKWGWDTLMAMLDDFAKNQDTASVVRKNLKMEPADFDKEFLAKLEADTRPVIEHFDEWKKGLKQVADAVKTKDWSAVIKEGSAIRDFYPEYVEDHSIYEMLAQAYTAQENKPAAMAELQRYVKAGGRNPASIKQLAKLLEDSGNKKEAAAVLERLKYIYLMDMDQHQQLGALWFEQGNAKGAVQEFQAVAAYKPIDPARAHYDLARAYHLNHQDEKAKDELLSALEAAPGYRQAQKLLLELSSASASQPTPKKQ
jgi:tetratricopeptide (TPR) repeat protein